MSRHRGEPPTTARLLTAYACAAVATGLPWPLLLLLVWEQYGALAAGLAGAARMAPYALLSWAVGSLGDHVRRDRLVRATMALRLLFITAAGIAVARHEVVLGVVLAALAVTVGTPAYPAIAASLPRLAREHQARATEALVTIEVSAWVVGPALGGLLLAESMRSWTFVVAVGLAVVGLLLSSGIAIPGPTERAPDAVSGMLRLVLRCPPALGALGLAGLLNVVVTVTGVVLLPLSSESWGRGDAGYGLATACLGFGALGAPVLARLVRISWSRGLLVLAGAVLVVAVSPVPWPALPVLALAGATGVVVESLLTGTLQDVVPDRYRAGALGLADTIMVGACLVGSLVAPVLAHLAGARTALALVSAATLLPLLAVRLVPPNRPGTPYDARDERTATGPDPRGAPAVGASRLG